MIAVARRYRKDFRGALAATEALIEKKPDHGRVWQERGHTLLSLNQPDEAASAFGRAVELNPGLAAAWRALANLHAKAGRTGPARFAASQVEYLDSLPRELAGVIDLIHEGKLYKAEQLCRQFLQQKQAPYRGDAPLGGYRNSPADLRRRGIPARILRRVGAGQPSSPQRLPENPKSQVPLRQGARAGRGAVARAARKSGVSTRPGQRTGRTGGYP